MNLKIDKNEIDTIKQVISDHVRYYRIHKNWTQESLAQRLWNMGFEISINTISCIENGHRIPSVLVLKYIAEAYGVSIDDLIYENIT